MRRPATLPAKLTAHDWGETDYDWYATRVCKRCGVVHKYDHGPNNGPETFTLGFATSERDPGCIADDKSAATLRQSGG